MNIRKLTLPLAATAALATVGCADNYAVEGAALGAAAGAGVSAVTGADLETSAAVGAAAGGAIGYFTDKNDTCDGYNDAGYLDNDCR
ncbi:YMGG-like glycine zipper-containing protein [Croceicoccus sp. Ery15]|jgi:osmotically inducible lipoprotein OsmB|uniref:YMGG-like glycine zipper-containing protein n=1 Tax=Croceicoccus sp. Ery15 TaxID=1703338 RepID=UPI001E30FE45|nr:YMGG-like glycine zipper-containing protein [Croceicoccus sp. Ery15]